MKTLAHLGESFAFVHGGFRGFVNITLSAAVMSVLSIGIAQTFDLNPFLEFLVYFLGVSGLYLLLGRLTRD